LIGKCQPPLYVLNHPLLLKHYPTLDQHLILLLILIHLPLRASLD
jgi:hypothetical protein